MNWEGAPLASVQIEAVLFDLDGVVTDTARVHADAWKILFDEFLLDRAASLGTDFIPFDLAVDYSRYVDGKPRDAGVRSFLKSRCIELPDGTPDDSPGFASVWGLGNRKNRVFCERLRVDGVPVIADTVEFIHRLLDSNVRCAVVSSSRNCTLMLRTARLQHLFEAQVDGTTAALLNLRGKPSPDTFLWCANLLNVPPQRVAVVEDAIAGIRAASSGDFGLAIALDTSGLGKQLLLAEGADVVLTTCVGVEASDLNAWAERKLAER